jgi:hypothetical protein
MTRYLSKSTVGIAVVNNLSVIFTDFDGVVLVSWIE